MHSLFLDLDSGISAQLWFFSYLLIVSLLTKCKIYTQIYLFLEQSRATETSLVWDVDLPTWLKKVLGKQVLNHDTLSENKILKLL